jgi:hypothetical protein
MPSLKNSSVSKPPPSPQVFSNHCKALEEVNNIIAHQSVSRHFLMKEIQKILEFFFLL